MFCFVFLFLFCFVLFCFVLFFVLFCFVFLAGHKIVAKDSDHLETPDLQARQAATEEEAKQLQEMINQLQEKQDQINRLKGSKGLLTSGWRFDSEDGDGGEVAQGKSRTLVCFQ